MTSNPVVRFAPGAAGLLHAGNVRTALFHPLGLALAARGTGMAKLLPLIGRAKAAARLSRIRA